MTLSSSDIRHVLDALQSSDWDEAVITVDDVTIAVARNGLVLDATHGPVPVTAAPAPAAQSAPVPAPPAATAKPAASTPPAAPPRSATDGVVVTAPSVGVFWRSPQPGSPPFVEVGGTVAPGDTLCIIEVMKLMNNVVAEVPGTVTAIHIDNATQVEFGTPLITIAPTS